VAPRLLIALALFFVAATPARAGLLKPSKPLHVLAAAVDQDTDPLLPFEWWRAAIGADQLDSPGPGKPVTVVDSGLDITHPEFVGRPNTEILNRQTTSEPDEDHGTAVSSVVGATNNGVGLVGVYPNAVLRMFDASPFGILDDFSAVQGIRAAALRGPGVINLSFGGETDDPMLQAAIDFAVRSGSLVVAAAGNDGGFGSPPNYPAFYPHVLTVGATERSNQVAAFSSVSPTVDLAAPGVDMPIAEPLAVEPTGYTTDAAGTSFASPLVAGAAAWVWTTRPELDNSQLFEVMRRSATDIGTPGFDSASGYGLLNIPRALSYKAPLRDPQEPNEQPREIEAKGLFSRATAPLTVPGRTNGSIAARVDRSEDPLDLYRAWAPAGRVLRVRATGSVLVRVLERAGRLRVLAVGRRGSATYRNRVRGRYVYIEVRAATRLAEYRLRITTART
jgi:subtilisin family serine protease